MRMAWRIHPTSCAELSKSSPARLQSPAARPTGSGRTSSFKRATTGRCPTSANLLGTRLVGSLNRRGRRVDVARTIFYRRRKGTPVVMEALIQDITGWEGAVVESFKRLARARHRLDPEPAGFSGPSRARLREAPPICEWGRISDILDGPFDDIAHTPDFRRNRGVSGSIQYPQTELFPLPAVAFEVLIWRPLGFWRPAISRSIPRGATSRSSAPASGSATRTGHPFKNGNFRPPSLAGCWSSSNRI